MNKELVDLFREAIKLKEVLRFQDNPKMNKKESSADHAWRTALMAMTLTDGLKVELDTEKALRMALVHNLFEIYSDNVDYVSVANGKVSPDLRENSEKMAVEKIGTWKPENLAANIHELIIEYRDNKSLEAKFIKAVSKLETLDYLVNCGYESYDSPELIMDYADKAVGDFPTLQPVLDEIKARLQTEFDKGNIKLANA